MVRQYPPQPDQSRGNAAGQTDPGAATRWPGEVSPDELRQLRLLFGAGPGVVRREIGRDVLDLRVRQSPEEERWAERLELAENLLETLRHAVDFIGRHNPLIKELTVDSFQNRAGQ
ncbi:MAG: hypothetical protein HS126_37340 [Anaerolineales bacterium]|nr:hypothetical protein [Anaerolineales bacterium]